MLNILLFTTIARQRRLADELFSLLHEKLHREKFFSFRLSEKAREEIITDLFSKKSVERIVRAIFSYMSISFTMVDVVVSVEQESHFRSSGTVGQYVSRGGTKREIHNNIKRDYSLNEIFSILCHESIHHYLWRKDVIHPDNDTNEKLTDVAAIYFDFGYYVKKGNR